jgi:hypothetical protein
MRHIDPSVRDENICHSFASKSQSQVNSVAQTVFLDLLIEGLLGRFESYSLCSDSYHTPNTRTIVWCTIPCTTLNLSFHVENTISELQLSPVELISLTIPKVNRTISVYSVSYASPSFFLREDNKMLLRRGNIDLGSSIKPAAIKQLSNSCSATRAAGAEGLSFN